MRFTASRRPAIVMMAAATTLLAGLAGGPAASAESTTAPLPLPESHGKADAAALKQAALEQAELKQAEKRAASKQAGDRPPQDKVSSSLKDASGSVSVFVEFSGPAAADAAAASTGGARASTAAADRRVEQIEATAQDVTAGAREQDAGATQLFTTKNAMAGVGLRVDAGVLPSLAARTDVVKVSPLVAKRPSTAGAAQLTGVLKAWQDTGRTGEGVSIGVIDTGIDYTHADFGGPGTPEAFEQAQASNEWTPSGAVVGGHDFVGDDYTGENAPAPDPNPLDCEGHGTHVAGIAAGRGVNADGSTFTGDYSSLSREALYDLKVAPGMAPQASLYALRVFGCEGSSNAILPALDWALDPNGDGDFGDRLDIVNLSLGSDFGVADDPDSRAIDKLAEHGVLPVVSTGNSGDLTDIGGSPASGVRSLSVAASVDEYQLRDGLRVVAPEPASGVVAGQVSQSYDWDGSADVTGDVVMLTGANADGCDPLSPAETAAVAGKVAWLEWDNDPNARRCGSVGRANNVAAAGATGFIFTSDTDLFAQQIAGSASIPGIQLTATATDALRPAAAAGTLRVTFSESLRNTVQVIDPSLNGTLRPSSSRGSRGLGVIKPDVAAPGDTITSAKIGSGSAPSVESGASMATPAVAGIAALVKQAHPSWTPAQVKSAVMNGARGDLTTAPDGDGERYGPARVGAGQANASAAIGMSSLAYSADSPGGVSVSFGFLNPSVRGGTLNRSQKVVIENHGSSAKRYSFDYDPITTQPGVRYSVRPGRVKVNPGESAEVTVHVSVNPFLLRNTREASMDAKQNNSFLTDENGNPTSLTRPFVASASGRLLVTSGEEELRVPVYTSARPASSTRTSLRRGHRDRMTLVGSGTGLHSGFGSSNRFSSELSVLTHGAESPRLPECSETVTDACLPYPSTAGTDLRHVGAGSTVGRDGSRTLWFGISTWSPWSAISDVTMHPGIAIDTGGDGEPDVELDVIQLPGTDFRYSVAYDMQTWDILGMEPINFNVSDPRIFDNDVMLIPVDASVLGLDPAAASQPISYTVYSYGYADDEPFVRDEVGPVSFDIAKPGVVVDGPLYPDHGGTRIPVKAGSDAPVSALVLHLAGQAGQRAEVVPLRP